MEKEIHSAVILSVVLITLSAIIAMGYGVFRMTYSAVSDKANEIQTDLNNIADSQFDMYDDTYVSGAVVRSTMEMLANKPYAILVNTRAMNAGKLVAFHSHKVAYVIYTDKKDPVSLNTRKLFINFNALLNKDGSATLNGYGTTLSTLNINTSGNLASRSRYTEPVKLGGTKNYYYISGSTEWMGSAPTTRYVWFTDNYLKTNMAFATQNSNIIYDTDYSSITDDRDCTYINNSAKFKSKLIKAQSGEIQGIIFEQV